jgi:hypothetical protein
VSFPDGILGLASTSSRANPITPDEEEDKDPEPGGKPVRWMAFGCGIHGEETKPVVGIMQERCPSPRDRQASVNPRVKVKLRGRS